MSLKQQVYFAFGFFTFALALLLPLDAFACYPLSMHTRCTWCSIILLTIVGPPLLLRLPREVVQTAADPGRPWTAWRFITRPLLASFVFNVVFLLIHPPVHIISHLPLMETALVAWWPVLAPGREYGEISSLMTMLYLVANTVPGQLAGAVVTLTNPPSIYSKHAEAPFRLGGLLLQYDREIGGQFIWAGTAFLK